MLDTNLLLDWLLDRDAARTEIIDKLLANAKRPLHIPDAIVVELAFALEKFYELPRHLVVSNLRQVVDEQAFNCNKTLFREAITEYAAHPAWSFLDACLLNYAVLQDAVPVWTFDKKLISQGSGRAQSPR